MEISIQKTITEKNDIQFPCYVKCLYSDLYYYMIYSETGCIQVCTGYGLQIQECNPSLAFHLDYEFNEVLTTLTLKIK